MRIFEVNLGSESKTTVSTRRPAGGGDRAGDRSYSASLRPSYRVYLFTISDDQPFAPSPSSILKRPCGKKFRNFRSGKKDHRRQRNVPSEADLDVRSRVARTIVVVNLVMMQRVFIPVVAQGEGLQIDGALNHPRLGSVRRQMG
jgi:hypothetical protein